MSNIPHHIAIIMDGNGRWAAEHGLERSEGHKRGAKTIENIVAACHKRGIEFLTLYAFSEENWSRPSDEVRSLMELLRFFLRSKRDELLDKKIKFVAIGDTDRLSADLKKEIEDTSKATNHCDKMTLLVALSYGSRQEMIRAVNALLEKGKKRVEAGDFEDMLYTAGIPDPDLLIRTSGEFRISNFLLWQMAYTEFYFTDTLWPDFDELELDRAIESYAKRERRFGKTSEQIK